MLPARVGLLLDVGGASVGFWEYSEIFFFPIILFIYILNVASRPNPPPHVKRFLQGYEMFLHRESFKCPGDIPKPSRRTLCSVGS